MNAACPHKKREVGFSLLSFDITRQLPIMQPMSAPSVCTEGSNDLPHLRLVAR